ncbi:MAG: orotate phosphoribosyltransferase [Candidatus Marinimicrobia bacterium]|nr:orotate phosphoribosyltransferase [Candidatus Neomarinimicrobiota bacterium]
MNTILDTLKTTGAILEGHFLLTSGLHSNKYIEKFRLIENPKSLDLVCNEMAKLFSNEDINLVLGAAVGGILISGGVGRELNLKHIFTERVNGIMELRRGFTIDESSKVLIVEDIVTTGGSIFELIDIVNDNNGQVMGITSILDRNQEPVDFGHTYKPLVQYPVDSYPAEQVPDWLNEIPITKPGRSGKK